MSQKKKDLVKKKIRQKDKERKRKLRESDPNVRPKTLEEKRKKAGKHALQQPVPVYVDAGRNAISHLVFDRRKIEELKKTVAVLGEKGEVILDGEKMKNPDQIDEFLEDRD